MQMKSTITLPPQLHQIEIELELFNKFIPLTLIISQKITPYAFIRFGKHRQPMLNLNCQK